MYRLLVLTVVIMFINIFNMKTIEAACDYDKEVCPCFASLMPTSGQPVKVLHRIVDIFEDGVQETCAKLDKVTECVASKTKTCDGTETGRCKTRFQQVNEGKNKICGDKKQELIDNTNCLNKTEFKTGIEGCESHIAPFTSGGLDSGANKPSCAVLQQTEDCIDASLHLCPAVRRTLDDIYDMYLTKYFQVENCDLDHNDDDAASMTLSTLSLLLACLIIAHLTMMHL